jgi:hypothetical protein
VISEKLGLTSEHFRKRFIKMRIQVREFRKEDSEQTIPVSFIQRVFIESSSLAVRDLKVNMTQPTFLPDWE